MPLTVFEFRELILHETATLPEVIKASREKVEEYIPVAEFGALFGGYITWRPPAFPIEAMPGEAIGVWGRRNVSKFRRLLSERGADVRRVQGRGPKQSYSVISRTPIPHKAPRRAI